MTTANIPTTRRAAIVRRDVPGVSSVRAAEIKNEDELAYAIRFLTDHYTYKRSKTSSGTTQSVVNQVSNALNAVGVSYAHDVAYPLGLSVSYTLLPDNQPQITPISMLGCGNIINPFKFTGNDC